MVWVLCSVVYAVCVVWCTWGRGGRVTYLLCRCVFRPGPGPRLGEERRLFVRGIPSGSGTEVPVGA